MTLPFFQHVKNEIKKEVKHKIMMRKYDESELIKFSINDLKGAEWEDEEEFFFDGSMYDVVKTEVINGVQYLYCFRDHKENLIHPIKKIADFFSKKPLDLSFNKAKKNYRFLKNTTLVLHITELKLNFNLFIQKGDYSLVIMNLQTFYSQLENPPKHYC